jgi:ketosteroid isomerase-like protein
MPGDPSARTADVAGEVRALLTQQTVDWNRGNIEAFMDGYWRDDRVRFASGGELKRGWQNVMSDYKLRYPDGDAMGELRTVGMEISEISNDAALVFGQWVVSAGSVDYCGLFTLLVRKFDGRWLVVHDHTSWADDSIAAGRTCKELAASNEEA